MEYDVIKTNLLAIAAAGLLILFTGIFLYLLRDHITKNTRFFMPIPALGVAAYIFAFNMFRHYNGKMPRTTAMALREIALSTAVAGIVFSVFVTLLVLIIGIINK